MPDQPGVILGTRLGPFPGRLEPELVRQYAEATNDPNPASRTGLAPPPAAIVTQIWEAQQAAFTQLIPEYTRASMTGGVHGEHDVILHRPILPGEDLHTWVEGHGSQRGGAHNLVTMHYSTFDALSRIIAEQWWTTVLINAVGDPVGEAAPRAASPDGTPRHIADHHVRADPDMPRRYAEVSGDWSPHHFSVEAARQSGSSRPFLHGLCTMALCAQAVVALVADGDPDRVRRLGLRFVSPTFVGDDLVIRLYRVDESWCTFEAESQGATVIRKGVAQLRS